MDVLFDIRLKNRNQIVAHPLTNDESVVMNMEDMLKFMSEMNHKPKFVALNEDDCAKTVDFIDRSPREVDSSKQPTGKKGDLHILGITVKKEENFPEWYSQVG